jgi:pimeloyl-ACP methyl ester carboxylesterase
MNMQFVPIKKLASATMSLGLLASMSGAPALAAPSEPTADVGFIDIGSDIKLRRMVIHAPKPKGTVLFLHGFPETLYVWKDISLTLGKDYDVHAFDWPGYGQSSRPPAEQFSYAPKDYARVLKGYIDKSGIDKSRLVIYGTDIGALPALLLALDEPKIAKQIVVGDFAPFDRPQYMYASLQSLKTPASAEATHASMNKTRDEILANAYRRGLDKSEQFDLSEELNRDMAQGWDHGSLTSADAFYRYYSHFTRDQDEFESRLAALKTPIMTVWGEKDLYIKTDMGAEFAKRTNTTLKILPGLGHYPHLQAPRQTVEEVRAVFDELGN